MRLVTRCDFDGLVCAMILKDCNLIDKDIKFAHPKDIQEKKIEITENDIVTNLPYCKNAHLCFDHHSSDIEQNYDVLSATNLIIEKEAKSTARVVFNYYKNRGYNLSHISEDLILTADKGNSADFTEDEILHPRDWVLLNFIIDARTGLGRFHDFRVSNYDLMLELIDYCLDDNNIDSIMHFPDLQDRINLYFSQSMNFKHQLDRLTKLYGDVAVIDLREEDIVYAGNRFMIYAMFPTARISIHIAWGYQKKTIKVMIGKSIFNKSSNVDIGEICSKYGGGGHKNAGTCQISLDQANLTLKKIIETCNTMEQLDPQYVTSLEDALINMYNLAVENLRTKKENNVISEIEYFRTLQNYNSYMKKYSNLKLETY